MSHLISKVYQLHNFEIYRDNDILYVSYDDIIPFIKNYCSTDFEFNNQIKILDENKYFDNPGGYVDSVLSISKIIDILSECKASKEMLSFLLWLSNLHVLLRNI